MVRVLFLCEKNDGLSQIAEGLAKKMSHARFRAYSAGVEPSPIPNLILNRFRQLGIDPGNHRIKHLDEFKNKFFDYVIWIGNERDNGFFYAQSHWPKCRIWHAEVPDPLTVPPDDYLKKLDAQIQFISAHVQLFVLCHHEEKEEIVWEI